MTLIALGGHWSSSESEASNLALSISFSASVSGSSLARALRALGYQAYQATRITRLLAEALVGNGRVIFQSLSSRSACKHKTASDSLDTLVRNAEKLGLLARCLCGKLYTTHAGEK